VAGGAKLILIALPPDPLVDAMPVSLFTPILRHFPGQVFLGAAPRYDGHDPRRFNTLAVLSRAAALPLVAVGDVLMHHGARRPLADVLTCLRKGCTIDTLGRRALANAERRLKAPADMARMIRDHPAALRRTLEIATCCTFSLDELSYDYPHEASQDEPAQTRLEQLTAEGLARRFPHGVDADTKSKITKELRLIDKLGFAAYFLTVHDIIIFARSRGILCQGRGSAANLVVCYALGVTEVPPGITQMVFERFISEARGEPPDIDVDFEHERREVVIQNIYEKYGRHRSGLTATVIHFRSRAAVREVGKVMGLSQDIVAAIAGQSWGWPSHAPDPARLAEIGLDPTDSRLALTLRLMAEIIGFPRHLSQHAGGAEPCGAGPAGRGGRVRLL
jgi:error-prone DNA polymerase